jgi:hypothetical protein
MVGSRQRRLWNALKKKSDWRFPYLGFHIFRKGGEAATYSQRVRPFLYASIGSAVAAQLGIGRVDLADNGVVSLGLPINGSVIGAQTSRTTHYKFLSRFESLLEALGLHSVSIGNPLRLKTRAEALTVLKDAGYADLVALTNSCSHSRGLPTNKPQCGCCSQCIDRIFGTVAAGLEAVDPPTRYGMNIFFDALPEGDGRTLATHYLEFARQILDTRPEELFDIRPELFDCIPSDKGAVEAASEVAALLKRHGKVVVDVVGEMIRRASVQIARGQMPITSLVVLAGSSLPQARELPLEGNIFRREGEYWVVSYDGIRVSIHSTLGLEYLRYLVARQGEPVAVRKLEAQFSSHTRSVAQRGRTNEKARQAVTKAINGAISTIRLHNPSLANHLDRAVVRGLYPVYAPSSHVDWQLTA